MHALEADRGRAANFEVEAMQLRSFATICRWAAVLAGGSDANPTTEQQRMTAKPDDMLIIGEAVKWLGSLGGHSPSPSAGPPGPKTLVRGFESIALLARYFDASREKM